LKLTHVTTVSRPPPNAEKDQIAKQLHNLQRAVSNLQQQINLSNPMAQRMNAPPKIRLSCTTCGKDDHREEATAAKTTKLSFTYRHKSKFSAPVNDKPSTQF